MRTLGGQTLVNGFIWGWKGVIPVSGDYNGDGRADLAVYDPAKGNWYACTLDGVPIIHGANWGWSATAPVPGDYNGDGQTDAAVFHAAAGNWYILDMPVRVGQRVGWVNETQPPVGVSH